MDDMNVIPPITKEADELYNLASSMVDGSNEVAKFTVSKFIKSWEDLWEHPIYTPQQVFDALGTRGKRILELGAFAVTIIGQYATFMETEVLTILGVDKYLTTKYPVDVAEDGRVTVLPPED